MRRRVAAGMTACTRALIAGGVGFSTTWRRSARGSRCLARGDFLEGAGRRLADQAVLVFLLLDESRDRGRRRRADAPQCLDDGLEKTPARFTLGLGGRPFLL